MRMRTEVEKIVNTIDQYIQREVGEEVYCEPEDENKLAIDLPDLNSEQALQVIELASNASSGATLRFLMLLAVPNTNKTQKQVRVSVKNYAKKIGIMYFDHPDEENSLVELEFDYMDFDETRELVKIATNAARGGEVIFSFSVIIQ